MKLRKSSSFSHTAFDGGLVFSVRIRVINVTFCYTADKLESGKNIVWSEKMKT